jgi:hypothetical protein
VLHEQHAQHAFNSDRRSAAFALGVMRLHHRDQLLPRQDLVHGLEEHVALGGATELLEVFVGGHRKSLLLHGSLNASTGLSVDLFQRSPSLTVS